MDGVSGSTPTVQAGAGETLAVILKVMGLSQAAFANMTGMSTKHINQIIRGKAHLTPETAIVIADVLAMQLVAIDVRDRMVALRRLPSVPGVGYDPPPS